MIQPGASFVMPISFPVARRNSNEVAKIRTGENHLASGWRCVCELEQGEPAFSGAESDSLECPPIVRRARFDRVGLKSADPVSAGVFLGAELITKKPFNADQDATAITHCRFSLRMRFCTLCACFPSAKRHPFFEYSTLKSASSQSILVQCQDSLKNVPILDSIQIIAKRALRNSRVPRQKIASGIGLL